MGYYPIFVEMSGRRCVVIGGGAVAERKVQGLLQSNADVTVISPDLTDDLRAQARAEKIRHIPRTYRPGDLDGAELIFAATDDRTLNEEIHQRARERCIWMNAADDPSHCDFILPAVIWRGPLAVAISTGGESPAAARAIREELDAYLSEDLAAVIAIAADARRSLREENRQVTAERWNDALHGDFRRLLRTGKVEQAKRLLLQKLGAKV